MQNLNLQYLSLLEVSGLLVYEKQKAKRKDKS